MSGPRFFNRTGPVPVTLSGFPDGALSPAQRVALGRLPAFDRSRAATWPTDPTEFFEAPMAPGLPSTLVNGVAVVTDTRQPNLYNFANIGIAVSSTLPAWQANYHRSYLLIQNLDAVSILLISFGTQPNLNSALQLPPGIGFEWDDTVPNNAVYVGATGAITIAPIGIEGTEISPSSIPVGI